PARPWQASVVIQKAIWPVERVSDAGPLAELDCRSLMSAFECEGAFLPPPVGAFLGAPRFATSMTKPSRPGIRRRQACGPRMWLVLRRPHCREKALDLVLQAFGLRCQLAGRT